MRAFLRDSFAIKNTVVFAAVRMTVGKPRIASHAKSQQSHLAIADLPSNHCRSHPGASSGDVRMWRQQSVWQQRFKHVLLCDNEIGGRVLLLNSTAERTDFMLQQAEA